MATQERAERSTEPRSERSTADPTDPYSDRNVIVDAHEDTLRWRARLKANPTTRVLYRSTVGVVGLVVVIIGIIMLPAPGPGWLVVFAGLSIWASEFEWAHRVLQFAKRHVLAWTHWVGQQSLWLRGLVAAACLVGVLLAGYLLVLVWGLPTWTPSFAADLIERVPGLSR